jgi:Response regulators consisting of a CheY-like receiver domain and a winged-helix DNA-binding domain
MIIHDNVRFEDLTVTLPELTVCFRGQEIHLTLTQLRLLLIFLSDPYGRFASQELIRRAQLTSKQYLNVLITDIRSLLDHKYIYTIHGVGYAFALERPS